MGILLDFQQEDTHKRSIILEQAFYMFAAVFSQGHPRPPIYVVVRIIHASYWIFLVTIVAVYTGQLVALRAITKITLPINSLEELSENPLYEVSIPAGTALFDYFRLASKGPFNKIWQEKIDGNPVYCFEPNVEAMLELVPSICTSNHVIVVNTDWLEYVISTSEYCHLAMADEKKFGGHMSLATYKGFPHMKTFNKR